MGMQDFDFCPNLL